MMDLGRLIVTACMATILLVTVAFASPIEFEASEGSQGFENGMQKRYSEFLGGPGKRALDNIDEPVKRYSEFLGGPGKRYSEFLGGPGKRSRQENLRNMAKVREAIRVIIAGARPQDLEDRR
ncbi:uncharacterized protein LOC100907123 [Galendromus occidentalis]|uniref:Uncharacterized protein LOC100907123 n=1 Tax=Galendromus occidentalis TaxID=34638 RepID=A0AAJ6QPB4_9ACAR|nr:uncharacterized protein LOC100907123 [Galendromus occidentalis]